MALWQRQPMPQLDDLRLTLGESIMLWGSIGLGCLCWVVVGVLLGVWVL